MTTDTLRVCVLTHQPHSSEVSEISAYAEIFSGIFDWKHADAAREIIESGQLLFQRSLSLVPCRRPTYEQYQDTKPVGIVACSHPTAFTAPTARRSIVKPFVSL